MAEKHRTPKPPRTVQAPQRRDTPSARSGSGGGSTPRWVWAAVAGGVAAIAAAAFTLTGGAGGESSTAKVKSAMEAAGCTYRDVKPLPPKNKGNFHGDSPTLTTKVKWSTFPPSSGGHYGTWAVWNFYTSPVNPRMVVHNEEHGAVVIWWGPKVPASTVAALETFYNEKPGGMLGTPIAGLGDKIALTSWTGDVERYYRFETVEQPDGTTKEVGYYGVGHIAICPRYDETAFTTFRDAFRNKGPEGVPGSANEPGMGP